MISALVVMATLVAGAETLLTEPVDISVVAIQATHEQRAEGKRHFDPALSGVRSYIESRDAAKAFDTFKRLKAESVKGKPNLPTRVRIDKRYAVVVTAVSRDNKGRVRLNVSVNETKRVDGETTERKALHTTSFVAPDKHLLLGGLHLDEGQLLIVITLES